MTVHILFLTLRLPFPPTRETNSGLSILPESFLSSISCFFFLIFSPKEEWAYIEPLKKWFGCIETVYLPAWKSYVNMGLNILNSLPFQVSYFKDVEFKKNIPNSGE